MNTELRKNYLVTSLFGTSPQNVKLKLNQGFWPSKRVIYFCLVPKSLTFLPSVVMIAFRVIESMQPQGEKGALVQVGGRTATVRG